MPETKSGKDSESSSSSDSDYTPRDMMVRDREGNASRKSFTREETTQHRHKAADSHWEERQLTKDEDDRRGKLELHRSRTTQRRHNWEERHLTKYESDRRGTLERHPSRNPAEKKTWKPFTQEQTKKYWEDRRDVQPKKEPEVVKQNSHGSIAPKAGPKKKPDTKQEATPKDNKSREITRCRIEDKPTIRAPVAERQALGPPKNDTLVPWKPPKRQSVTEKKEQVPWKPTERQSVTEKKEQQSKRARTYTPTQRDEKDCSFLTAIYFYQQLQGDGKVGCGEEGEDACF